MSGDGVSQPLSPSSPPSATPGSLADNPCNGDAADVLTRSSRRVARMGTTIIIVLVAGFGSWASFAPLASGVVAGGVVVADGERGTVRHLDGGIVGEILVSEGQAVKAGQVLIRLDDVRVRANLGSLLAEYDGCRARHARLRAERSNARTISFPADLTARENDPRAREIMQGEIALFNERRAGLETELEMIAKQRGLYERHIAGTKAQIHANKSQLAIVEKELSGLEDLFEKGYAPHTRILKLKREKARLEGDIGRDNSSIAQSEIKIVEARVEAHKIRTEHRREIAAEFRDAQDRMFDLEEQIRSVKDTLVRLDIRAPKSGAVLDLRVHAKNAVLLPGDPVLDIVPTGKTLIVEAKVRPTDIDNVLVGSEAEVRFPAFRRRTTPSVFGVVAMVAADTLVDSAKGEAYYTARIVVAEDQRDRLAGRDLVPGMPADVTIRAGERTLIEYLLEPLTDVMARSFKE